MIITAEARAPSCQNKPAPTARSVSPSASAEKTASLVKSINKQEIAASLLRPADNGGMDGYYPHRSEVYTLGAFCAASIEYVQGWGADPPHTHTHTHTHIAHPPDFVPKVQNFFTFEVATSLGTFPHPNFALCCELPWSWSTRRFTLGIELEPPTHPPKVFLPPK